jgi:hypothetical protein
MLKGSEGVVADVGENQGEVFAAVTFSTQNEETAASLSQVAQGLVAMGRIAASLEEGEMDAEIKQALKLLDSIRFTNKGNTVSVHVQCAVDMLLELMDHIP